MAFLCHCERVSVPVKSNIHPHIWTIAHVPEDVRFHAKRTRAANPPPGGGCLPSVGGGSAVRLPCACSREGLPWACSCCPGSCRAGAVEVIPAPVIPSGAGRVFAVPVSLQSGLVWPRRGCSQKGTFCPRRGSSRRGLIPARFLLSRHGCGCAADQGGRVRRCVPGGVPGSTVSRSAVRVRWRGRGGSACRPGAVHQIRPAGKGTEKPLAGPSRCGAIPVQDARQEGIQGHPGPAMHTWRAVEGPSRSAGGDPGRR